MAVTPVCSSIEELSKLEDTEFYNALIEYDLNQHVRDGHFLPDDRAVLFDVQKKIAAYHSGLCKDMFAINAAIDVETWQPDEGEEQLEDLQMMKQVLQRDMYILEGKWPTYRSLLAPIRWLPDEILVNIFSYAIEDHAFNIDALALPACAKVCRRWYDIFSSSSQLWRSILVPEPLPCEEHLTDDAFSTTAIGLLAERMQHSSALRLSAARDILARSKQGLLAIELGPSSLSIPRRDYCGFHQDKAAQFVLSQANRCNRLVLRDISLSDFESLIAIMKEGHRDYYFPGWVQLRMLVIEVDIFTAASDRTIRFLTRMDQLRTLTLSGEIGEDHMEDCSVALGFLHIQNLSLTISSWTIPTIKFPELESLTISLLQYYYSSYATSESAEPIVVDVKRLKIFLHDHSGTQSFVQAPFFLGTKMVSVTDLIIVELSPQSFHQRHSFSEYIDTSIHVSDFWMTRLVAPSAASLASVALENLDIADRELIDMLSILKSLQEFTYHQAASHKDGVHARHDVYYSSDGFMSWLTLSPWIPDVLPRLELLDLKISTDNLGEHNLVKMVGSRMEPRSMETKRLRRFRLSIMGEIISPTAYAAFGEMRKTGLLVSVIDPEGLKL